MSRDDEDEEGLDFKSCTKGASALARLFLLIITVIRACTLFPPGNISYIVGADVHTNDANLITWYCQDDARFYNCTSNGDETLAPNLPPVVGVASDSSGTLTILFEVNGSYMLGDINGPKTPFSIRAGVKIYDIATNKYGTVLTGLCIAGGKVYDCFGNPGEVFDVEIDQKFMAITLSDETSPKPILWCYFDNKVQHCKSNQ